eukprot:scaffold1640_cov111-Isochrysis_galbana.AAC.28
MQIYKGWRGELDPSLMYSYGMFFPLCCGDDALGPLADSQRAALFGFTPTPTACAGDAPRHSRLPWPGRGQTRGAPPAWRLWSGAPGVWSAGRARGRPPPRRAYDARVLPWLPRAKPLTRAEPRAAPARPSRGCKPPRRACRHAAPSARARRRRAEPVRRQPTRGQV